MFNRYDRDFDRTLAAMDRLQRHMTRAFDELDHQGLEAQRASSQGIRDLGDKLVLEVDLPGVGEKDLQLSIHQDVLSLKGERKSDAPEGYYVHRQERTPVEARTQRFKFAKNFALPCKVDFEKTTAALKNGVLTVTLPKAPEARPRQINVLAQ